MLVLSRKRDERIVIGKDIIVTVVAVQGNTVRLGIDAPSNVRVMREELYATRNKGTNLPGQDSIVPPV